MIIHNIDIALATTVFCQFIAGWIFNPHPRAVQSTTGVGPVKQSVPVGDGTSKVSLPSVCTIKTRSLAEYDAAAAASWAGCIAASGAHSSPSMQNY